MTGAEPQATVVGERDSWHGARIRGFLDRNIHPYRWVDAASPRGAALLEDVPEEQRRKLPVVICPDGLAVGQPTNIRLARMLGIASRPSSEKYDAGRLRRRRHALRLDQARGLRGETDVELLSNARNHIDEADPDRTGQTDEQILARAEKLSA